MGENRLQNSKQMQAEARRLIYRGARKNRRKTQTDESKDSREQRLIRRRRTAEVNVENSNTVYGQAARQFSSAQVVHFQEFVSHTCLFSTATLHFTGEMCQS